MDLVERRAAGIQSSVISRRFNPLACGGTELPPQLLILAKLLFVCLVIGLHFLYLGESYLAFLPFLEHASDVLPQNSWRLLFLVSGTLLCFNVLPRVAAFVCGGLILYGLLLSRLVYSNNIFFCGCLFVLIGLSNRKSGGVLIRTQLVILYFGAALDKLLSPAWQDGTFLDFWQGESALYGFLSAQLAPFVVAKVLSWATIMIEFGLALGFALPRKGAYVAWVGAFYHLMTAVMGGGLYAMFVVAAIASYVALLDFPPRVHIAPGNPASWRARMASFLCRFDADERMRIAVRVPDSGTAAEGLTIGIGGKEYTGITALQLLLLLSPVFYVVMAFVMGSYFVPVWLKIATLSLLVALFFPFGSHASLGGLQRK